MKTNWGMKPKLQSKGGNKRQNIPLYVTTTSLYTSSTTPQNHVLRKPEKFVKIEGFVFEKSNMREFFQNILKGQMMIVSKCISSALYCTVFLKCKQSQMSKGWCGVQLDFQLCGVEDIQKYNLRGSSTMSTK